MDRWLAFSLWILSRETEWLFAWFFTHYCHLWILQQQTMFLKPHFLSFPIFSVFFSLFSFFLSWFCLFNFPPHLIYPISPNIWPRHCFLFVPTVSSRLFLLSLIYTMTYFSCFTSSLLFSIPLCSDPLWSHQKPVLTTSLLCPPCFAFLLIFSPSTGLLVLCQKQWWWRATSWQWGRWMMLSTPPSSVRSRIGSGPAGTKSPLLSLVSLLTQWQHTHKQAHTPCICVDVCTNEMEIHVYLPVNMMNTHWWPNTILHHTQQEYSKQHVITACTHIHSHTHTHTLWAMLVPWQYSTLSQCTYACTYSLIRLFRWMDTLADTHAQKHTFLSHPCTHSGIRADLRAAGMLISLSLHIGLFFFKCFPPHWPNFSEAQWRPLIDPFPTAGPKCKTRAGVYNLRSKALSWNWTLHGYTAAGICSSAGCKFKVNCGVW